MNLKITIDKILTSINDVAQAPQYHVRSKRITDGRTTEQMNWIFSEDELKKLRNGINEVLT